MQPAHLPGSRCAPGAPVDGRVAPGRRSRMQTRRYGLLIALWLLPAAAAAQVRVEVTMPSIRFETAPPLVTVNEGVQVVPDYDEEVFFTDGWYWHRRGDLWFRTRDHRGGWVVVERRYVPVALVRIPPGKYRHHRPKKVRVYEADGRVSEVKVKDKGGVTGGKVKEKRGKGRWEEGR